MGSVELIALVAVLTLAVIVGSFGLLLAGASLWLLRRGPEPEAVVVHTPAPAPVPPAPVPLPPPPPVAPVPPRRPDPPDPSTDELTSPDAPLAGSAVQRGKIEGDEGRDPTATSGMARFLKGDDADESTEVFDHAKMSQDFAHLFVSDEDTTASGLRKPAKPAKPKKPQ